MTPHDGVRHLAPAFCHSRLTDILCRFRKYAGLMLGDFITGFRPVLAFLEPLLDGRGLQSRPFQGFERVYGYMKYEISFYYWTLFDSCLSLRWLIEVVLALAILVRVLLNK